MARGGGFSICMTALSTRDWALRYASLGWRVFPVMAGGKRPLYSGWHVT
jgi:Bifunctional DNA primase/polymerase, N-terminal